MIEQYNFWPFVALWICWEIWKLAITLAIVFFVVDYVVIRN